MKSNKRGDMLKKYGGVKNWKNLDDIEEAITYATLQVRYSSWDLFLILLIKFLKLIPPVVASMLLLGGLFVLIGTLTK